MPVSIVFEKQYPQGRAIIRDDCYRDKTPEEMQEAREEAKRIMRQILMNAEMRKQKEGA